MPPAGGVEIPPGGSDVPDCPYDLGAAGTAWWAWAWASPQAARWDEGALYTVARRAVVEDLAAALDDVEAFDVESFMAEEPVEAVKQLRWLLETLKASATGFVGLSKEMRELEGQLGFGAKSMVALGWSGSSSGTDGEEEDEVERARKRRAERIAGQSTAGAPTPS